MAWLSGWPNRISHNLVAGSGAGTNYQKRVKIHSGSGTNSGEDVYLGGKCTSFPNDIRFTDDDGTTELDHWCEDLTADPAVFWIEVKDDLDSNQSIYIYYGKSGASSSSNGVNTFLSFENFEGYSSDTDLENGQWHRVEHNGSTEIVTDGSKVCKLTIPAALYNYQGEIWETDSTPFSLPFILEAKVKQVASPPKGSRKERYLTFGARYSEAAGGYDPYYADKSYFAALGGSLAWGNGEAFPSGFALWKLVATTTVATLFINGNQKATKSGSYSGSAHMYMCLQSGHTYTSDTIYEIDDIRVRKYASTEPTDGSWGSWESAPLGRSQGYIMG